MLQYFQKACMSSCPRQVQNCHLETYHFMGADPCMLFEDKIPHFQDSAVENILLSPSPQAALQQKNTSSKNSWKLAHTPLFSLTRTWLAVHLHKHPSLRWTARSCVVSYPITAVCVKRV